MVRMRRSNFILKFGLITEINIKLKQKKSQKSLEYTNKIFLLQITFSLFFCWSACLKWDLKEEGEKSLKIFCG